MFDWFYAALLAYIFVLGTAAGSFANVCACRVPRDASVVAPRSACPVCGAVIRPLFLVPLLGFVILRGRCRDCDSRISLRYPASELAGGLIWAALFCRYGLSIQFLLFSVFFSILLAVFLVDLEFMLIPNIFTICAMVPAAAMFLTHVISPQSYYGSENPLSPLLGLIPGAGLFIAVYAFAKLTTGNDRSIGMGDIKLMFPTGLILGFSRCLSSVAIAVLFGGAVAAVLLATKKKGRKDSIPFGPFIVIGAFVAALLS